MVGIAGAIGPGSSDAASEMTSIDEESASYYAEEDVSICSASHDLLAGDQPVRTASENALVWVIGELYGFDDEPLGGDAGHTPRPRSMDSATYCARLYDNHGIEAFRGINGNYAAIILDRTTRTLSIVTDRLASIPIYHARSDDGTFVFSTDVQEVPLHPAVETEFDPAYLHEYLAFKRPWGVKTPLVGIEELQPGAVTTVDLIDGSVNVERYWRPQYRPQDEPFEHFVEEFTTRFTRIVEEWVRDDLEYGVLLSGGSDSRLNLAALGPGVTAFHMADWMSREARIAEQAALTSDNEFVLLQRDAEYQASALERNRPLTNFNGWFTQAYTTGFEEQITDRVDVLVSGMYADTLFKGHAIPSPPLSLGPLGTITPPIEKRIETVGEFIDWLLSKAHDDLDMPTDLRTILEENIHRDGDVIVHHGIEYDSIDELVYCSPYYPLTNDDDVIFRNSLRQMIPYRTPYLDNRLLDLSLSIPIRYRLRRNLINRALVDIDRELASVPHASTGVSLTRPFPVEYVGELASEFWEKYVRDDAPPQPYMSNGPWVDDAELIRSHEFFGRAIEEHADLADSLPFLSVEEMRECYRNHLDGEDNLVPLYTLMTVLSMPLTERLVRGYGRVPDGGREGEGSDRDDAIETKEMEGFT